MVVGGLQSYRGPFGLKVRLLPAPRPPPKGVPGRWGWEAGIAPAPGAMAYICANRRPADCVALQPRLAGYGADLDVEQLAITGCGRETTLTGSDTGTNLQTSI